MTAWKTSKQAPRKLGEAATQPKLVGIASPPRRLPALMFGILMVGILVAGLVGALVLSTALQTREFELRRAQTRAAELGYQVSDLESLVNRTKAPLQLGRRATELGMVPNPHSVFIDLGTGTVVGAPVAAKGHEIPSLRVLPPPPAPAPTEVAGADGQATQAPAATQPSADPANPANPVPVNAANVNPAAQPQPTPSASVSPSPKPQGGQG